MYRVNIKSKLYLEHMLKTNKILNPNTQIIFWYISNFIPRKCNIFEKKRPCDLTLKPAKNLRHLRIALAEILTKMSMQVRKKLVSHDEFQFFFTKI